MTTAHDQAGQLYRWFEAADADAIRGVMRNGPDTLRIAEICGVPESEVWNKLAAGDRAS